MPPVPEPIKCAAGLLDAGLRKGKLVSLEWAARPDEGGGTVTNPHRFTDWLSAFAQLLPDAQWSCLAPGGTPFQRRVWRALLDLPAGTVASYGQLAAAIGRPSAARAVGGAVGANPIAILIPCHRVVSSSGDIGGYRWGLSRKQALLAAERSPGFTLSDHFRCT